MIIWIYMIDDDAASRLLVKEAFASKEFQFGEADNAQAGLDAVSNSPPDLLILDRMMPGRDGVEICRILRSEPRFSGLPILMLTAETRLEKMVHALDSGADDWLGKPFAVQELRARVRALLRRKSPWLVATQEFGFGALRLDPATSKASIRSVDAGLTKLEFEILYLLAAHASKIVQRDYLSMRVLAADSPAVSRALDVHVSRIRSKLGPYGVSIETARGLGYVFKPSQA